MHQYVSRDEVKTYAGITGTFQDDAITMMLKMATRTLNEMLGVSDLALHLVEGEVHDGAVDKLELKDTHIVEIGTILEDGSTYTQDNDYDFEDYKLYLDDFLDGGFRTTKIDYAAGWNASGMATIDVSDVAGMASNATINVGVLDPYVKAVGTISVTSFASGSPGNWSGKTVTIAGHVLSYGTHFTDLSTLTAAINALSEVDATSIAGTPNIITITAASVGVAGNSITMSTTAASPNTILSNSTLIGGSGGDIVLTRGVHWTAQATAELEAEAIADAIAANVSGVRTFSINSRVYVIEDSDVQVEGRALTTSDSTRLEASDSTLTNVDFPEDLRQAVILLVIGYLAKRRNAGVQSYTIGSKSVSFASEDDKNQFEGLINPYLRPILHVV